MNDKQVPRKLSRRDFLRIGIGAGGALTLLASAGLVKAEQIKEIMNEIIGKAEPIPGPATSPPIVQSPIMRLAATDGHFLLPGRDPLYGFGFVQADLAASVNEVVGEHKGKVQWPAPIIGVDEDEDVYITLTNLGLVVRPDLDDSHTIHWHGFRNPTSTYDGVPEVSIAVPAGRDFDYFYRPHDAGTYMYHCHFEDTEHVQMGMQGIIYVRPAQNGDTSLYPSGQYVYNDGDGSTGYDRHYTLLFNEVDTRPHDNLENVQEFIWSDYKPNYWIINGRSYPDTVKGNNDPSLAIDGRVRQPVSSLMQANPGEHILLRMANLGYEQHTMQMMGIPLHVVGHDAVLLRSATGIDLSYMTHNIFLGAGEARDAIFTAPAFDSGAVAGADGGNRYNVYLFRNRNFFKTNNNGAPGLGGMVTEVRVYENQLPGQVEPNQLFGV